MKKMMMGGGKSKNHLISLKRCGIGEQEEALVEMEMERH